MNNSINETLKYITYNIIDGNAISFDDYLEKCLEYAYEYINNELSKIDTPIKAIFNESNKKPVWCIGNITYVKREK